MRAQAGVRHVLQEIAGDGHCAAYREKLLESAAKLLEIPGPIIEQAVEAELALENLVAEPIEGKPALFMVKRDTSDSRMYAQKLVLDPDPIFLSIQLALAVDLWRVQKKYSIGS